jgi:hypothetical protein
MPGSLTDLLPDPISAEDERILLDLLKRKATSPARLAVELLHAMEARFGPEARDVVREMAAKRTFPQRANRGEPQADLHQFCAGLDKACAGSHTWERVLDTPDAVGYHYTRCLWAEIFRSLGEPELGFIFCAGDEPAVKAYNPDLAFQRTKTLMEGDDLCDHVFCISKSEGDT